VSASSGNFEHVMCQFISILIVIFNYMSFDVTCVFMKNS